MKLSRTLMLLVAMLGTGILGCGGQKESVGEKKESVGEKKESVGEKSVREIEPQLYEEARKHIAADSENVVNLLAVSSGESVELVDDHVNFSKNHATVYMWVRGKGKFLTVKFRLQNDEWSMVGPIEVKYRQ
jgi:hypothetical protein